MLRLSLLVSLAVVGTASAAAPPLEAAKHAYEGLQFEECLTQLRRWARRPPSPPEVSLRVSNDEHAEAELYEGLCRYDLGQTEEAQEHFERATRWNPAIRLPRDTSPKIQSVFRRAQARVELEPPGPPLASAPGTRAALPPPTVTPAALPPLRPRPPSLGLPIGLGAGAVVSGAAFIYLGLTAQATANRANSAVYTSDASNLARDARREAVWANVGLGVAVAAAAGAILSYFLLNPPQPTRTADAPAALASW